MVDGRNDHGTNDDVVFLLPELSIPHFFFSFPPYVSWIYCPNDSFSNAIHCMPCTPSSPTSLLDVEVLALGQDVNIHANLYPAAQILARHIPCIIE